MLPCPSRLLGLRGITPGWQGFMSDYWRTGITPCLSNKEYVFHCMHAQADYWRGLRDAHGWQGFMSGYWRTGATPHWVLAVNPAAYPSKVPDLGVISQGAHPLVTLPLPLCKHVCTVAYL
jgi:hypothetical protein